MSEAKETIKSCSKCAYKTTNSLSLASHHLSTHVTEAASQIFESQVSKLMSKNSLMELYKIQSGSLMQILSDQKKTETENVVVQVICIDGEKIQISDGESIITHCVIDANFCNSKDITLNSIIKLNKWIVIDVPTNQKSELYKNRKKSEHGLKLENFDIVENTKNLPVLGQPKPLSIEVKLSEVTDLDTIVISLLDNINVEDGKVEAAQEEWCGKMQKILKKASGKMWMCTVCRVKISESMDDKVVSHAQAHLRYFPGYKCPPPHGCKSETLVKYKKHLLETEHDKVLPEPEPEIKDVNKDEGGLTNVLEELTNIFDGTEDNIQSEYEKVEEEDGIEEEDKVHNYEDEEEDGDDIEESSSVAEELANFFAVPTDEDIVMEEDVNSGEDDTSCTLAESSNIEVSNSCDKQENISDKAENDIRERQVKDTSHESGNFSSVADELAELLNSQSSQYPSNSETPILPVINVKKLAEKPVYQVGDDILKRRDKSNGARKVNEVLIEVSAKSTQEIDIIVDNEQKRTDIETEVQKLDQVVDDKSVKRNSDFSPKVISGNEVKNIKSSGKTEGDLDIRNPNDLTKKKDGKVNHQREGSEIAFNWEKDVLARIQLSGKYFSCKQCKFKSSQTKGWTGPKEILTHISETHLSSCKSFQCPTCKLENDSLIAYTQHMKSRHKTLPMDIGSNQKKIHSQNYNYKFNSSQPEKIKRKGVGESENQPPQKQSRVEKDKVEIQVDDDGIEVLGTTTRKLEPFNWHEEMMKRVDIGTSRVKCTECGVAASSVRALIVHMENYHFKHLKKLLCGQCGVVCDSFINYNSHMRLQHQVKFNLSLTPFSASLNKRSLSENSSLEIINESVILGDSLEKTENYQWQAEIMSRVKLSGNIYLCSDCKFQSRPQQHDGGRQILGHIESSHMSIQGYRCSHCYLVIASFIEFYQHLNKAHDVNLRLLEKFAI